MRLVVGAAVTAALTLASVVSVWSGGPDAAVEIGTGANLFVAKGCSGCHTRGTVEADLEIGPDLTDLASVAAGRVEGLTAEEYVRQSIRYPGAFVAGGYGREMPHLPLSDAEVDRLVDLLLGA